MAIPSDFVFEFGLKRKTGCPEADGLCWQPDWRGPRTLRLWLSSWTLVSKLCVAVFRRVCLCQQVCSGRRADRIKSVVPRLPPLAAQPAWLSKTFESGSFVALRLRLSIGFALVQRITVFV